MNTVVEMKLNGYPRIVTLGDSKFIKITHLTKHLKMTASEWIKCHDTLITDMSLQNLDTVYKRIFGPPRLRGIYVSVYLYHLLMTDIIRRYQRKLTSMRRSKCLKKTKL